MSVAQFIKLVETVGIPILVATAAGWALWRLLQWVLKDLRQGIHQEHVERGKELQEMKLELDEEIRDLRTQAMSEITEIKGILIRLVDRVRLLDQTLLEHDSVARTVWGIQEREKPRRTRSERRDELEEELRGIGKNGD